MPRSQSGGIIMDRTSFEATLQRDGYEIVARSMEPNTINPEHAHEFDARVLVIAGEMTLDRDGARRAYRPGETFEITNGHRHAEIAGPDGASYVAGRRMPG
jgi:quercetin dioxygenase-like cupin family protein